MYINGFETFLLDNDCFVCFVNRVKKEEKKEIWKQKTKNDKEKERVTKFSILIRCKINILELINFF